MFLKEKNNEMNFNYKDELKPLPLSESQWKMSNKKYIIDI